MTKVRTVGDVYLECMGAALPLIGLAAITGATYGATLTPIVAVGSFLATGLLTTEIYMATCANDALQAQGQPVQSAAQQPSADSATINSATDRGALAGMIGRHQDLGKGARDLSGCMQDAIAPIGITSIAAAAGSTTPIGAAISAALMAASSTLGYGYICLNKIEHPTGSTGTNPGQLFENCMIAGGPLIGLNTFAGLAVGESLTPVGALVGGATMAASTTAGYAYICINEALTSPQKDASAELSDTSNLHSANGVASAGGCEGSHGLSGFDAAGTHPSGGFSQAFEHGLGASNWSIEQVHSDAFQTSMIEHQEISQGTFGGLEHNQGDFNSSSVMAHPDCSTSHPDNYSSNPQDNNYSTQQYSDHLDTSTSPTDHPVSPSDSFQLTPLP